MKNWFKNTFPAYDPSFKPVTKRKPKRAQNWLRVNIGEREGERLRALAQCCGITLKTFLHHAIRLHSIKVAGELNLERWEAVHFSQERRKEIARRSREFERKIGYPNLPRNWAMKTPSDMRRVSLRLHPAVKRSLDKAAKRLALSRSAVIRLAIRQKLDTVRQHKAGKEARWKH
jgi:hypothetical protein